MNGDPRRARDILAEMRGPGRAPHPSHSATADVDVAGRVRHILRDLLRVDRFDAEATFGQLGGDSLLAVRVLSRCRQSLAVDLPLRALGPGVCVADFIDSVVRERGLASASEPEHTTAPMPDPLSSAVRSLVGSHYLRPDLPTYSVAFELLLVGALDLDRLRRALIHLVGRHDALRCSFSVENGAVTAFVRPDATPDFVVVTPAALADAVREPLALDRSPLRARLARESEDRHRLVMVVHHAVCDGLSVQIIVRELTMLYRDGDAAALPAPVMQASMLGQLEVRRLDRGRRELLARRWADRLDGAPEMAQLPIETARPARPSMKGDRVPLAVPSAQLQRLQRFAAAHDTTVFAALATVLAVLLNRYTGQDDLVVGVPMSGRREPQTQDAIGNLSSMVPLRLSIARRGTARQLLADVQEAIIWAQEHSDLPFEAIVDEVRPLRSPSFHPIFQVALVLLSEMDVVADDPSLTVSRRDLSTGTSKFDLSWYFQRTALGLDGYVEFSTDLFSSEMVGQMAAHFRRLLESLVQNPTWAATRLPMYAEDERLVLTEGLHGPVRAIGADVQARFVSYAQRQPEHPALWHRGVEISYGRLNAASNGLARHLRALGVGPEVVVGICIERSPEQIASLLAVLKTGAGYVPLDPTYPDDRLQFMIDDSAVRLVLTTPASRRRIAGAVNATLVDVAERFDEDDIPEQTTATRPDQLAYMIYTSGSTGRPKGVQLSHRGLANVIESSGPAFRLGPDSRILQFVSFSFDASVWEIMMALGWGATLCLGPADLADATSGLEEVIRASGATVVYLPPALLTVIEPSRVPSVEVVITGGDRIGPDLRDRWLGRARFFAAYGPTEATIVQTWAECHGPSPQAPPIGDAIDNVRLYVLDQDLQPVPYGCVGEVYVGGAAVGRGYHGRSALTADRFLPDPHACDGSRLYRTGDLVRRGRAGELQFVGRVDDQVKVRGYRVELGEVDAALRRAPQVKDVLVRVELAQHGRPQLVAYVVPTEDPPPTDLSVALRRDLRDVLPAHMIPAMIYAVPVFPLTPNGKIDVGTLSGLINVDRSTLAVLLSLVEVPPGRSHE
jgi:amino acid adenylation domain-containing protein